jgi:hypothetical protein
VSGGPQGQDELIRPSQNVLFSKDGGKQVAGFNKKLTRYHKCSFKVEQLDLGQAEPYTTPRFQLHHGLVVFN